MNKDVQMSRFEQRMFQRTMRVWFWKKSYLRKSLESHRLTGKHDGEIAIEIFFHLVQFSRILGYRFKTEHNKDISFTLWSFYLAAFRWIGMFPLTCATLYFLTATGYNFTEGGYGLLAGCSTTHQQHKRLSVYCWCSANNSRTERNG